MRQQFKDAVLYPDIPSGDNGCNILSLLTQEGDGILLLVQTQQREVGRQLFLQSINNGGH